MTFFLGYYIIEILKKNKVLIEKIPFISDFLKKNEKDGKINSEAYIILLALSAKDFLF